MGRPGGKLTPQVRIGASLKIMLDELLTEKTLLRAWKLVQLEMDHEVPNDVWLHRLTGTC